MGKYVAENTVKKMIQANRQIKGAKVAIWVLLSKKIVLTEKYKSYRYCTGASRIWYSSSSGGSCCGCKWSKREYGIDLCKLEDIWVDAVVVAVAHDEFKRINLET